MTLLLSQADVEGLLDLPGAMEATRQALREQAAGAVTAVPPRHIAVPRGALRVVSGALIESQRMGVRLGPAAGFVDATGGDSMIALLWDSESGALLTVMAYPFSRLRTGGTIGVATELLARADSRTVGMIGTGRNALSLLQAACHVRPVERIRVHSRNAERREAFAARAQQALGVPVEATADAAAATREADIVYVATDALAPVLHADWLAPGAFVGSMGRPSEIDPSVYLAAQRIVVGHRKHEEEYFDVGRYPHQLLKLIEAGQLAWSDVHELCDVLVGRAPGRTAPDQLIIFKESQGGFGDIAFADLVYARARERGVGQEWAFYSAAAQPE
ncbi:MAG TPA: NAD(P)-binding domain-containing protein [Chloroflexota bacterium]|nr:NAD(P)-binding domain-containing protein [Chloroflexota bacterium]